MKTLTRQDVAMKRGVTPARITQIAVLLGISPAFKDASRQAHYWMADVRRILKFDTKPGPKTKKQKGSR